MEPTSSVFNYELELEKANKAAEKVKPVLEQLLLGRTHSGYIGGLNWGEARAIAIVVPGNPPFEYQVTEPILYNVIMEEINEPKRRYGLGILNFLTGSQIREIFYPHFKDVNIRGIKEEYFARKKANNTPK